MTVYTVKLSLHVRRDGRDWVVRCPIIDVATQARTRNKALELLREAVELWFESCISRRVLDQALTESGFSKLTDVSDLQNADNCVVVRSMERPAIETVTFKVSGAYGGNFLEGWIPALLAKDELGSFHRASV